MIDRLVSFALSQRFIVMVMMLGLSIWGIVSFERLPIDAYPDLSPPRVQIVTQATFHALPGMYPDSDFVDIGG